MYQAEIVPASSSMPSAKQMERSWTHSSQTSNCNGGQRGHTRVRIDNKCWTTTFASLPTSPIRPRLSLLIVSLERTTFEASKVGHDDRSPVRWDSFGHVAAGSASTRPLLRNIFGPTDSAAEKLMLDEDLAPEYDEHKAAKQLGPFSNDRTNGATEHDSRA